ncbi:MAG: hypothetical protein K2Y18_02385 [Alphaproteobacteria bacterium]|jgi:hypothetical protein|nr:hypothetical protein [Alphaproteobacteria bacterium]
MKQLSLATLFVTTFFVAETMATDKIGQNDSNKGSVQFRPDSVQPAVSPPTFALEENRFNFPLYGEAIVSAKEGFALKPLGFNLNDPVRPHLNAIITAFNEANQDLLKEFYQVIASQDGKISRLDEKFMQTVVAHLKKDAMALAEKKIISGQMASHCRSIVEALMEIYLKKMVFFIKEEQERLQMTFATHENRFDFPLCGEAIGNEKDGFELHPLPFNLNDPARRPVNDIIKVWNEQNREMLKDFYYKISQQKGGFTLDDEQIMLSMVSVLEGVARAKNKAGVLSDDMYYRAAEKLDSLFEVYFMKLRYMIQREPEKKAIDNPV